MKKVLLALVASASLFSACKKERTCTCTTTIESTFYSDFYSGVIGDSDIIGIGNSFDSLLADTEKTESTVIKDTKKKAEEKCESYEGESSSMGITQTTTCELED